MSRAPARPSGSPPPVEAVHGGRALALAPLAAEVARRHLDRHAEDAERYGDLAGEWAVHDMQHVLGWAFAEAAGFLDLGEQVAWLARVLDARGYPLANLADCLEDAAAVVDERVSDAEAVSARLRDVAATVRP